ncbi:uncharacterized protein LOC141915357 [Tubulanus polymorphus]|uniref:uncharacterized protein LOC141915357 n=1 Tax=Tubulanus polymorphus TaxID=672921 RepID=UPI003DA57DEC
MASFDVKNQPRHACRRTKGRKGLGDGDLGTTIFHSHVRLVLRAKSADSQDSISDDSYDDLWSLGPGPITRFRGWMERIRERRDLLKEITQSNEIRSTVKGRMRQAAMVIGFIPFQIDFLDNPQ